MSDPRKKSSLFRANPAAFLAYVWSSPRRACTDILAASHRSFGISALLPALALAGCGGVLDPHGPIGRAERVILFDSLIIMLLVVVPTILLTLAFAWWFRATNLRARYRPGWVYSGSLEVIVWAIPTLVILFLGGIAWVGSHDLDPYKAIRSQGTTQEEPVEIEVVSLDWKWLFIYPGSSVASVNQLVIPAGTPVHFSLTSATVMNSFFVPQLGGQIYTMAGMTSQLSLLADQPGVYHGLSAQFSGDGFSDMHFEVQAVSEPEFAAWIATTQSAGGDLDAASYRWLSQPGVEVKPRTFGAVDPGIFQEIIGKAGMDAVDAGYPAQLCTAGLEDSHAR